MESTHTASSDIPKLNKAATIAHIFSGMANHSLLSVAQLCNEGYSVTFKIEAVKIYSLLDVHILKGAWDLDTGLWRINLRREHHQHPHVVADNVYELRITGALVNYLHKAMSSPTKSALLKAFKNIHVITSPGLTEQAINKHLKLTPATTMGHMNQLRQNIRSTSKNPLTSDMDDEEVSPAGLGTENLVYEVVVDQGQLYTDLTGRFPVISSKGNWYGMVCYAYDCN
jgi:hypothetical protein